MRTTRSQLGASRVAWRCGQARRGGMHICVDRSHALSEERNGINALVASVKQLGWWTPLSHNSASLCPQLNGRGPSAWTRTAARRSGGLYSLVLSVIVWQAGGFVHTTWVGKATKASQHLRTRQMPSHLRVELQAGHGCVMVAAAAGTPWPEGAPNYAPSCDGLLVSCLVEGRRRQRHSGTASGCTSPHMGPPPRALSD